MILVVDAGGTYFRAEIYLRNILQKALHVSASEIGLSAWIESVLQENRRIKIICISYAGQVKDGVILASPNIKIDIYKIKSHFETKFGVKLFIENDLNCAVLAEAEYFQSSDICAVYVGTGLGLGVVSSSVLIRGSGSTATELGHIPYKKTPLKCGCSRDNCIELFASGLGIQKWKKYYNLSDELTLSELKNSQNRVQRDVYEEFIEALLFALGTVITLFNPKIVVFGGGVIAKNNELCEIISSKISGYALNEALKEIEIVNTKIQNASLAGAFLLKDQRWQKEL